MAKLGLWLFSCLLFISSQVLCFFALGSDPVVCISMAIGLCLGYGLALVDLSLTR
jgi:hypothetical protein